MNKKTNRKIAKIINKAKKRIFKLEADLLQEYITKWHKIRKGKDFERCKECGGLKEVTEDKN